MASIKRYLSVLFLITITAAKSALALEPAAIYAKAKEFTVQIDGEETGTGTIVERSGNTYTVLTSRHVMDTPGSYTVTTSDGNTYRVTKIQNLPNADIAVITFETSDTYPVAELGSSSNITSGTDVYVVGYPDPFPGIPKREYLTESAEIQTKLAEAENGYQIIHNGSFTPGSSGGGIFDIEARLIGINGQFISEANTGKSYGAGIPIEVVLATQNNLPVPIKVTTPEDFVSVGKDKLKQKDYQGAIAQFDKALESVPSDSNALFGRAEAYYLQEDFELAIGDFNTLVQNNPENPKFFLLRGRSYAELKEDEKAVADYTKAINLEPQHTKVALVYYIRGLSYNRLGEATKAIADYTEVISLDPQNADSYYRRGATYADLGKYEQALVDLNKAIDLDPQNAGAYFYRGNSYVDLGNRQQAIVDFQQAASLYQEQGNAERYRNMIRLIENSQYMEETEQRQQRLEELLQRSRSRREQNQRESEQILQRLEQLLN